MRDEKALDRLRLPRALLALGIISTGIHYTHNFVMAGMYPPLPPLFPSALAFQIGIGLTWPLLTAVAIWGYCRYRAGELRKAGLAFIAYSILGISTLGHFMGPSPEIPRFFFATIFTDFLTGTAILIFGVRCLTARDPGLSRA